MKRLLKSLLLLLLFGFGLLTAPMAQASLLGTACTAAQEGTSTCNDDGCFKCESLLWVTQSLVVGLGDGTCNSSRAGLLRFTGTGFQGCKGSGWTDFSVSNPADAEGGAGDDQTVLLLHFNGTDASTTVEDSSPSAHVMTSSGPTINTTTYKFGKSSAYFNGTGKISTPDSSDFLFASDDFTIDFWMNTTTTTASRVITESPYSGAGNGWNAFDLYVNSAAANKFSFYVGISGSYYLTLVSTTSVNDGVWHHIAIAREGTTIRLFVDGNLEASSAMSFAVSYPTGNPLNIGSFYNTTNNYVGYLDEYRISRGIARWTSNFTPPTEPYGDETTATEADSITSDANTVLLLHMNDAGFADYSQSTHPLTNYSTTLSPSKVKFGAGAGYFNGASYLEFADSTDWYFASGDFTIDAWINVTACSAQNAIVHQGELASAYSILSFEIIDSSCALRFLARTTSADVIDFQTAASAIPTGIWTHVAVVRSGSTFMLYVNGSLLKTATSSTALIDTSYPLRVGARYLYGTTPYYFNGYIDELRVSKGIARWTTTFTPPTAQYE